MHENIHAPRVFERDIALTVEILNRAAKTRSEIAGIELLKGGDAAATIFNGLP